ncbi:MAG: glycoside-pentoside-hexuronide (GPH):cation symporter [Oscillospiraceae bacterium]
MNNATRNRYAFGLGTIGRDMFYTMVSMFLVVYLTEVLNLPDATMWWMTGVLTVMRIFDAFNDPFMGVLVDNTKTRWGKFKPWLVIGGVLGGLFMILMFTDFGLTGARYIIFFAVAYLLWDILYGTNDIAYWSMLPALSTDQKERERMGAFARICANIGLFAIVVAILPVTHALGQAVGDLRRGWFIFALAVTGLMLAFQMITVFGVKENKSYFKEEEHTTVKEMFGVIFRNDQLLWVAVSMALFMIGYCTTTSFGTYFFKYAYGDENMYSVFAAVLGVSQLTALAVFPLFSKKFSRKQLYSGATAVVVVGYVCFFLAPMNMLLIGISGMLMFLGQAFIQLLMLMFLADTIEYGQLKLGRRNESVTFSVQPFINKIGGALASGVVLATAIISGINSAKTPADVTAEGLLIMKFSMLILPLICILAGYIIYKKKYKIDPDSYAEILCKLEERGDIHSETQR